MLCAAYGQFDRLVRANKDLQSETDNAKRQAAAAASEIQDIKGRLASADQTNLRLSKEVSEKNRQLHDFSMYEHSTAYV